MSPLVILALRCTKETSYNSLGLGCMGIMSGSECVLPDQGKILLALLDDNIIFASLPEILRVRISLGGAHRPRARG